MNYSLFAWGLHGNCFRRNQSNLLVLKGTNIKIQGLTETFWYIRVIRSNYTTNYTKTKLPLKYTRL